MDIVHIESVLVIYVVFNNRCLILYAELILVATLVKYFEGLSNIFGFCLIFRGLVKSVGLCKVCWGFV